MPERNVQISEKVFFDIVRCMASVQPACDDESYTYEFLKTYQETLDALFAKARAMKARSEYTKKLNT